MLWRHLCLARAITAAGLLTCSSLGAYGRGRTRRTDPGCRCVRPRPSRCSTPRRPATLAVEVRGQGQDRVRVTLKNTSGKRLNVVLPPGLGRFQLGGPAGRRPCGGAAAAAAASRAWAWASASEPLGRLRPVRRGQRRPARLPLGRRRPTPTSTRPAVTVPAGQKVDVDIPAVCLNFGLPTPDPSRQVPPGRRGRLLEGRAGPQGPPLAWPPSAPATAPPRPPCGGSATTCRSTLMLARGDKVINPYEVALASRFLDALDQSSEAIDPAYLGRGAPVHHGRRRRARSPRTPSGSPPPSTASGSSACPPGSLCPAGEAPKTVDPGPPPGRSAWARSWPARPDGRIVVQAASEASARRTSGQRSARSNFKERLRPGFEPRRRGSLARGDRPLGGLGLRDRQGRAPHQQREHHACGSTTASPSPSPTSDGQGRQRRPAPRSSNLERPRRRPRPHRPGDHPRRQRHDRSGRAERPLIGPELPVTNGPRPGAHPGPRPRSFRRIFPSRPILRADRFRF